MTTTKKMPEPASPCVNCAREAAFRTTSTGYVTQFYCPTCAEQAFPTGAGLERILKPERILNRAAE